MIRERLQNLLKELADRQGELDARDEEAIINFLERKLAGIRCAAVREEISQFENTVSGPEMSLLKKALREAGVKTPKRSATLQDLNDYLFDVKRIHERVHAEAARIQEELERIHGAIGTDAMELIQAMPVDLRKKVSVWAGLRKADGRVLNLTGSRRNNLEWLRAYMNEREAKAA